MPFVKHECYVIVCSGCGSDNDNGDMISHFDSPEEAMDMVSEYDWVLIEDEPYCDKCWHYDEATGDERVACHRGRLCEQHALTAAQTTEGGR